MKDFKQYFLSCVLLFCGMGLHGQIITTVAGGVTGHGSYWGDGGPATNAAIGFTGGIAIDSHGNIYIGDGNNQRIRKLDAITGIITTIAGTGVAGFYGDGGSATAAKLNGASWIAIDTSNDMFIVDALNYRIRRIDAATGVINTIAGTGVDGFYGDSLPATSAEFHEMQGIAVDVFGNLYLNDGGNYRVRKVDSKGIITTVVGTGIGTNTGDGGMASVATISGMAGICTDLLGNVYLTDSSASIRKFNVSTGIITRLAGTGDDISMPYFGDGIAATTSHIGALGAYVNDSGNLFTSDYDNSRIEKVDKYGIVHTIAGNGISGFSGDGGMATVAQIYNPENVICDLCGNIYISDFGNKRVRKVTQPYTSPSINIKISPSDTVCAGITVTFSSVATGAGYTPGYKWYVNGSVVSTTGNTYTYMPANNDSIRCVITSSCSGTVAYSNSIYMVVSPLTVPAISISTSPGDTICTETTDFFTATATSGGVTPTYQWYVNSATAGTGATTYSYMPANGDIVYCQLTSSALCPSVPTINSNNINLVVDNHTSPSISLSGLATVSVGNTVTVTATVTGAGSSYIIYWMNKGIEFATTTAPTITYTKLAGTDTITAGIVPTATMCYDSAASGNFVVTEHVPGLVNLLAIAGLTIYPNPVKEVVIIGGLQAAASYRLVSVVGVVVKEGALVPGSDSIPVTSLPQGVYLLEISDLVTGVKEMRRVVRE